MPKEITYPIIVDLDYVTMLIKQNHIMRMALAGVITGKSDEPAAADYANDALVSCDAISARYPEASETMVGMSLREREIFLDERYERFPSSTRLYESIGDINNLISAPFPVIKK